LYDPIARKFIINRYVQFVETESWDGSIEKTIKIIDVITNDDMEEEVVQTPITSQSTTPRNVTQITTQNNPLRSVGA
jgi:hypothetical protein